MDFFPYEPFDDNQAQKKVWEWLKGAFKDEEGVAYYRYPIFTKTGKLNREPDILMLHRTLGLWVIECKGCSIDNIKSIQGHEWQMNNWYRETDMPVAQAEDQMFAIKNKLTERRETRGLISSFNFRVALPNVRQKEWDSKGFHKLPSTQGVVLVYENLTSAALKKKLTEDSENRQQKLSDREWELVKGVLGGTLPSKEPRDIPTDTPPNNPLRVIQAIESRLKILDQTQQQIAFEVPNGAQRLRGLAGTGKTVLLAKRAAKIHAAHPDWKIAFVFFTRSLYEQILELITLYYREMTGKDNPDWTKLKVLHAWGGREQDGFYRSLSLKCGVRPKTVVDVKNEVGYGSPGESFEYICLCLLQDLIIQLETQLKGKLNKEINHAISTIISLEGKEILENKVVFEKFFSQSKSLELFPTIYDSLLIDEGQDLPPIFYQLAYQILPDPKRLYWAYDEAQGIGSLLVPKPKTIFGNNPDGTPVVDLGGNKLPDKPSTYRTPLLYEDGIQKAHNMNTCYRTPRQLLMTAHAVNMGLFRKEGSLQGVTHRREWENLGYEVEGDFRRIGRHIKITRPPKTSPHPIDQDNFNLKDALGTPLTIKPFDTERQEREWIARQVAQDIKLGFDPWDIMITALSGDYERDYLYALQDALEQQGVDSYIAGVNGNPSIFRKDGCVTICNIYRAKGNEAWKVYACRFHYATQPLKWKKEEKLHKRNEAFVALTRARVWCVATGIDSPIFNELQQAIDQYPNFTFPAFNRALLERLIEDDDN